MIRITQIEAPTDSQIAEYVLAAKTAVDAAVPKAIIAGQMLIERRQVLFYEHSYLPYREALEKAVQPDPTFEAWYMTVCPFHCRRTANRWMAAAGRVMCFLLEEDRRFPPSAMEIDGEKLPISFVLTAPEADCTPAMLDFREKFKTFLADKTLANAAATVIDGESEAHRITRAANGKLKRYAGGSGDRKDYPRFIARALSNITSFLSVKKNGKIVGFRNLDSDQRARVLAAFDVAISSLPDWVMDHNRAVLLRESKIPEIQRLAAARPAPHYHKPPARPALPNTTNQQ
jgi:hypothetical protein